MARNTARAGPGTSVHLTETCEADQPHLLIHVATTPAPESDVSMTEVIQADLQEAQMLPSQHLLDTGYINADVLASSQHRFGIEVVSPAHPDVKWQANTNQGIDASQFVIDWEHKQATCPQGKTSVSWTPTFDPRHHEVIKIRFSTKDCQVCPVVSLCTSSKSRAPPLQAARKLQATKEFSEQYALRQGIEATISQGVRAFGLRRSRYIGLDKTHLQHLGIAAAINMVRVVAWLDGDELAPTRVSAFQRLYAAA